ncbi:glycoprotein-N-acetylgalactosamine 3-beta-galactosyltransferase 1-like [Huso huso]|uniref:N-acetylgalactosaminide beta-1,3-galactosyltransferase n=1 Tax=Huso huso TaxID=61971 RepID=A0ABR0YD32_HUSHU
MFGSELQRKIHSVSSPLQPRTKSDAAHNSQNRPHCLKMLSRSMVSMFMFACGGVMGCLLFYYAVGKVRLQMAQPMTLYSSGHQHDLQYHQPLRNTTADPSPDSGVRILCWVMTSPQSLQSKARHIKTTWGRRCDELLFLSSVSDPSFPALGLNTSEGRSQLYRKTMAAFTLLHDRYLQHADWFLKADDDSYVVMENLRRLLSKHDPQDPVYLGRRFSPYLKQGYMSGGAGYVLSREALQRYVGGLRDGTCTHTSSVEDLALGRCLEKVGVPAGDSRDQLHRESFHPFLQTTCSSQAPCRPATGTGATTTTTLPTGRIAAPTSPSPSTMWTPSTCTRWNITSTTFEPSATSTETTLTSQCQLIDTACSQGA